MAKKCTRETIKILSKKRAGQKRKVIAEFVGHTGAGCKPRRNPTKGVTPARLKPWAAEMKRSGPACARNARKGRRWNKAAYRSCIKQAMKHVAYRG